MRRQYRDRAGGLMTRILERIVARRLERWETEKR